MSFRALLATWVVLLPALVFAGADSQPAKKKQRELLRSVLSQLNANEVLDKARVSAQFVSLADGEVIYSRAPDELLNPASNVKLVTTAAALARLGLDFRFSTEFLLEEPLSNGRAKALYVRGKGDPTLSTERLYAIVSELKHEGLTEVQGDLILDDSYFDSERLAPGYDQEDSDRSYMAPTGALSLNLNTVGVYLRPGNSVGSKAAVELEPPSEYFVIEGRLTTGGRHSRRFWVGSKAADDAAHQRIEVRGSVPMGQGAWSVWKKIDHPQLYFGYSLKALLEERGVKVKGKVRVGLAPPKAKPLHIAQSETLDVVLKRLNKHSSNFVAEQLVKVLGAQVKGAPGTTAKGIEVVEEFLETEVGLARGTYVMKNGSGLNDTNRFSAAQLVKLLRHVHSRFSFSPEYLSSVPVGGKDGTLRFRFEGSEAEGRLRAKTGTLEGVTALSGYVQAASGELFAFSLIANDFRGRASPVIQRLDAMGVAVASMGSASGPSGAVATLTGPPSVVGPLEQLEQRMRTYLSMGRAQDKRNVPFLRTAWRSEKDPAVRAAVAEALYRSDPQDYLAARLLVDSFLPSEEVYGRLRLAARELSEEVPGLSSLGEVASSGSPEALARLLELVVATRADAAAQEELAGLLSSVARGAPEELLLAMRGAAEAQKDAVALLARGLVKEADPEHPLWPALRRAMGALDGELADFARRLEAELSTQIAQAKSPPAEEQSPARPGG